MAINLEFEGAAGEGSRVRQWLAFVVTNATGNLVNVLAYGVLVTAASMRPVLALAIASVLAAVINYLSSRHLVGDLLLVRLHGVLTPAEQQLVKTLPAERGRDLLKQVRSHLMETARPVLEAAVFQATGVAVVSLHHDISTSTGEEVVLFTLAETPQFRELKRK